MLGENICGGNREKMEAREQGISSKMMVVSFFFLLESITSRDMGFDQV